MSRRRSHLTKDQEKEILDTYRVFDVDDTNSINPTELRDALRALGFDVTKAEVAKIMEKKDPNNAGSIDFETFRDICGEFIRTRDPKVEILRAFQLFDTDHDEMIDFDDLKKISKEMGDNISDDDLRNMISKFDKDQDGKINLKEFFDIMNPARNAH